MKKTSIRSYKKTDSKGSQGSQKKPVWSCEHGCSNTNTPCRHLERLISEQGNGPKFESTHKYNGNFVDKHAEVPPPDAKWEFRDKLKEANLSPLEIGILTLKYAYDESFEDISSEFKMIRETVERVHNEAILKLRGMKW